MAEQNTPEQPRTFRVRLDSQTDPHSRFVNVSAPDEQAAREFCEAREAKIVEYSLDTDPHIDDAGRVGIRELCRVAGNGKIVGGSPRDRIRLHMHSQEQPYLVTSVEEI